MGCIVASQFHGPRFMTLDLLSVWISVHFLPMYAWVSSEFSGFLPLSKNILIDRWAIAPVCMCVHGVLQ